MYKSHCPITPDRSRACKPTIDSQPDGSLSLDRSPGASPGGPRPSRPGARPVRLVHGVDEPGHETPHDNIVRYAFHGHGLALADTPASSAGGSRNGGLRLARLRRCRAGPGTRPIRRCRVCENPCLHREPYLLMGPGVRNIAWGKRQKLNSDLCSRSPLVRHAGVQPVRAHLEVSRPANPVNPMTISAAIANFPETLVY